MMTQLYVFLHTEYNSSAEPWQNTVFSVNNGNNERKLEQTPEIGLGTTWRIKHTCYLHDQGRDLRSGRQDHYALRCPRAAPTVGVVACTYHHWFRPFSQRRRYCQLPVSGRRMQRFLQVLISCQLFLAVLLGANMLPGLVGSAHFVVVWLLQMICTCFLNVQLSTRLGGSMLLCFPQTPTLWGPFLHNRITCKFSSLF